MLYNMSVGEIWHKGKTENSVKAERLCHPLILIEKGGGIAMDNEYILFMIVLLLLVISIKK